MSSVVILLSVGLFALLLLLWAFYIRILRLNHKVDLLRISEQNFKRSEEKYALTFHASPDAVLIVRFEDMKIIDVNEGFEKTLGYRYKDAIGSTTVALDIWADLGKRDTMLKQLVEFGEVSGIEMQVKTKDGVLVDSEASSSLIHLDGESCILTMLRDISARKKAEQELKHVSALLEAALTNSPVGIVVADGENAEVQIINEAARRIRRISRGQHLGGDDDHCLVMDEKESPLFGDELPIMKALNKGEHVINQEVKIVYPDKSFCWVIANTAPVYDNKRKIIAAVAVYLDITDMKTMQQDMKRLNHELEQRVQDRTKALTATNMQLNEAIQKAEVASKAKSDFLANISHELRTPMNGILGMTQLAISRAESGEIQKFLHNIEKSAEILMHLINDVLDFSRIDSGQMVIERAPFNLSELIDQLTHFAGKRCLEKELDFDCEIEDQLPEILFGDALRIKQILINLLDNAVKFTPDGYVKLSVSYFKPSSSDTGVVKFMVIDSGIGINESDLPLLFDSFAQLDSSITRQYGGTGLGLALCQKLASLMNGVIEVESNHGEGSVFSLVVACPSPVSASQEDSPQAPSDSRVGISIGVEGSNDPLIYEAPVSADESPEQDERNVLMELKRVANFDLIQLSEKVGENSETVIRLLKMFCQDYSSILEEIEPLIESMPISNEGVEALTQKLIERVHALKGVSGNLCNNYIHTIAKDVESALRESGLTDVHVEHIKLLFSLAQKEALELKTALHDMITVKEPEAVMDVDDETKQSFLHLLSEIAEKMSNSFMIESDELLLLKNLGQKLGIHSAVEELEQSLSSFDYIKAEKLMLGISDQLEF